MQNNWSCCCLGLLGPILRLLVDLGASTRRLRMSWRCSNQSCMFTYRMRQRSPLRQCGGQLVKLIS